ncbi:MULTISPECIES: hypothetical protein [Bacillus cereus group]|uniref:hypothetical protein n=1 Tax=Bacillus cereus group TaxID=86661 RepID=UPI000BF0EFB8|nr:MULTISPECIES: hypothetical protein [Bacillus cereus group]PEI65625.1 hypothetical protein CN646_24810 [Bacillus wiedmannii]PEP54048.1 hypothetical protein CN557_08270 [Bacillus wiedmannii]PFL13978.1 hypothetical protein COJ07_29065 [Bacillus cereus]PFZ90766.1 hypothetical protein COL78_26735 [Bacillus wiedmannii]PGE31593.1 hypothetical protein COM52_16940 [Bacillus wiedmannii]
MVKLKLVCFLLPLILFVGGCGNTVKETSYEKNFLKQTGAMRESSHKMTEVQEKDHSLSSSQGEYIEAVTEFREVVKKFKELVPDSKYETQHKKLATAMKEYELATSKLLAGLYDTEGITWKEGIDQFNKATEMYVEAAGNIVDIRDGKEVGSTADNVHKETQQKDDQADAAVETEATKEQSTGQETEVNAKTTQAQTTEREPEPDTQVKANTEVEQSQQQLTVDKVKEIIEYYSIGANDKLNNVSVENGVIKATIALAPNGLFPAKDMAVNGYSQLADELLKQEGWQTLTVTYANVGSISMNRNEKETNEIGDYFPTLKIEERLK